LKPPFQVSPSVLTSCSAWPGPPYFRGRGRPGLGTVVEYGQFCFLKAVEIDNRQRVSWAHGHMDRRQKENDNGADGSSAAG
jgi:hypothetical protein